MATLANKLLLGLTLVSFNAYAGVDKHYSETGFFDIHVCNWPDQPLFFMALFSTDQYAKIRSIEVFTPDNKLLTSIGMKRYRVIKRKNKSDKHVFIKQLEVSDDSLDGRYKARVTLNDGSIDETWDKVIISRMGQANQMEPAHNAEVNLPLTQLKWQAIEGARYYQVFVRDIWDEGKIIFSSKLLEQPFVALPKGLIEADGWYSWKVHARDINEDILLGDFNHGSLSVEHQFVIVE